MAHEWEQYEDRYRGERPDTFAAYIEVWRDHPEAGEQFADWETFSRCANAEPAMTGDMPDRVHLAEQIMKRAGYVQGSPTATGARQWWRSPAV